MKRKVLILGAGKIGGAIVDLLFATGDYDITVADSNAAFLKQAAGKKARAEKIDVSDMKALTRIAKGQQATRNYAKRQYTWFRNQCGDWPKQDGTEISFHARSIIHARPSSDWISHSFAPSNTGVIARKPSRDAAQPR